ncbi:MAG: MgtC/SapB family protein [Bacteroidetes bacterium]|nr:MgtC/SapB family protein [Bacteroidota bacterium]
MITWQEVILRLFLAAIFGGAVGIDRQRHEWTAGLRTHMLVCLGSALIMIVSAYGFRDVLPEDHVALDPSRVAAQVISGIGFLGAGTILFLKHEVVKGLTTAAGLWTVAGIGLATGGGLYFAASATTVLVLIILIVLKPYKKILTVERWLSEIHLKINRQQVQLTKLVQMLNSKNIAYNHIRMNTTDHDQICSVEIRFDESANHKDIIELVETMNNVPGISEVDYKPGVA